MYQTESLNCFILSAEQVYVECACLEQSVKAMNHMILAVSSNAGILILPPVGGKVEMGPTRANAGEKKESVSCASRVAAGRCSSQQDELWQI